MIFSGPPAYFSRFQSQWRVGLRPYTGRDECFACHNSTLGGTNEYIARIDCRESRYDFVKSSLLGATGTGCPPRVAPLPLCLACGRYRLTGSHLRVGQHITANTFDFTSSADVSHPVGKRRGVGKMPMTTFTVRKTSGCKCYKPRG